MHEKPSPLATLMVAGLLVTCGCNRGSNNVEQIRRGVQNVDRHSKEIQREAQGPVQQPGSN